MTRRGKVWILLLAATAAFTVRGDIPVKGGCVMGTGQPLPSENPIAKIVDYARLYRESYMQYKNEERRVRDEISDLMAAKYWTQAEVTGFTIQQRELLYIGVASDLAIGRISQEQLPAYVDSIDRKIIDIELELGCQLVAE